jgi:hypothetical protein
MDEKVRASRHGKKSPSPPFTALQGGCAGATVFGWRGSSSYCRSTCTGSISKRAWRAMQCRPAGVIKLNMVAILKAKLVGEVHCYGRA